MSPKPFFLLAATLLAANIAYADCKLPKGPRNIPNGEKATKDQMAETHQAVQEYNVKTTEYTECITREFEATLAAKGAELSDKDKKSMEAKLTKKHNAATDKLQTVAARFNEQVRIFNAKNAAADAAETK